MSLSKELIHLDGELQNPFGSGGTCSSSNYKSGGGLKKLTMALVMGVSLITGSFVLEQSAAAGTIPVTNANNTGAGSYAQAIKDANSDPDPTITFDKALTGSIFGGGLARFTRAAIVDYNINATVAFDINTIDMLNLNVGRSSRVLHNGVISGSGALGKTGSGILVLNATNTYTNGTLITDNGGILQLTAVNALGSGGLIIGRGSILDVGQSQTIASLDGAGTITLAKKSIFTINGSGVSTFVGQIIGNGSLQKGGDGTLVLSGASNYAGGTTLLGGELWLENGQALGTGSIVGDGGLLEYKGVDISNQLTLVDGIGTAIRVLSGEDSAHSGVIEGQGSLIKHGEGTLTLSAENSYTGGTVVDENGGTLAASAVNALGSGNLLVDANAMVVINADQSIGTLTGKFESSGVVLNKSSLSLNQNVATVFEGVISGSGRLVKKGLATLTLSGVNSYGGETSLVKGMIDVQANKAFGDSAVIANGGGLIYTGELKIANKLTLNKQLPLSVAGISTQVGSISGVGGIDLDGGGTLTMSATNSYSGATNIRSGRLHLSGSASASDFVLSSGARLSGFGPVKSLTSNGGSILPGDPNTFGTFSIMQDVVLADNAVYTVKVDPSGNTDLIHAGGVITIATGAKLAVAARSGVYKNVEYTVATGDGGVSGTFGGVVISNSTLTAKVTYDAKNVKLTLNGKEEGPGPGPGPGPNPGPGPGPNPGPGPDTPDNCTGNAADRILDPNEAGAHNSICGMRPVDPTNIDARKLISAYESITDAEELKRVRRLVSGEGLASVGLVAIDNAHLILSSISRRLRDDNTFAGTAVAGYDRAELSYAPAKTVVEQGAGGPLPSEDVVVPAPVVSHQLYNLWASGFGGKNRLDGTSGRVGYGTNYKGLTVGGDYRISPNLIAGASFGYVSSDFKMKELLTTADVKTYAALAYLRYAKDSYWVNATLGYRWDRLESDRMVSFSGYSVAPHGKADGKGILGFIHAGYDIANRFAKISPYVGLDVITAKFDSFTETRGGAASLIIGGRDLKSVQSRLGVIASRTAEFGNGRSLKGELKLSWLHEFGDVVPSVRNRLIYSTTAFKVIGSKRARDRLEVGVRGTAKLSKNLDVYVGYEGSFGKNWKENTGVVGLRVSW